MSAAGQEDAATDQALADGMLESLRWDIVEGRLPPGTAIHSVELAQRFGTSRTPVREVLLLLERDGLLQSTARRKPHVAWVSHDDLEDLHALRRAMHGLVARAIVRSAPDHDLDRLRQRAVRLRDDLTKLPVAAHLLAADDYLEQEYACTRNRAAIAVHRQQRWRIAWHLRLARLTAEQLQPLADLRLRAAEAYCERDGDLAAALTDAMLRREASFIRANQFGSVAGA